MTQNKMHRLTLESVNAKNKLIEKLQKKVDQLSVDNELTLSEMQILKSAEIIDGMKGACMGEIKEPDVVKCPTCKGDGDIDGEECETCLGECEHDFERVLSWSTMKDVYKLMHETKVALLNE